MKKVLLLTLAALTLCSCSDAKRAKFLSAGSHHEVLLYSGGVLVNKWESTGKPASEFQSDGYYFVDAATGKLVLVSGAVVFYQK